MSWTLGIGLTMLGCGDGDVVPIAETDGDPEAGTADKSSVSGVLSEEGGSPSDASTGGVDTSTTHGPPLEGSDGEDAASTGVVEVPEPCEDTPPPATAVPRLRNHEYDAAIRDLLDIHTLPGTDDEPPSSLLPPDYDGPLSDLDWQGYLAAAERIAVEVISGPKMTHFMACDPALDGCFEETIRTFGRRAFRRPLTGDEVQRFMELTTLEPAGTPDEIAEAILVAFLVSPSFLLVPEFGQAGEDSLSLSSHEMATRLSLLLWGSIPDETLDRAADAGELQTPAQVLAQAQRMVEQRDKTAEGLASFFRHYANMRPNTHWSYADHDTSLYPAHSPEAIEPLRAELESFFTTVALDGGSFADLFLSDLGFVNEATAPLYELDPADFGPALTPVRLDPQTRPGFLTRAGFLGAFSGYAATSPPLRGYFIMRNILGIDTGPPPSTPSTPGPPEGEFLTQRAFFSALTAPTECGICHEVYLNPPGFVLESYDAAGGWQTLDPRGGPIDPVADVLFDQGDVRPIHDPLELMQALATSPRARQTFAHTWVSYVLRREPDSKLCIEDDVLLELDEGASLLEALLTITQSDVFRQRAAIE